MRVLVLGSGGREHALVWAIARSPRVEELLCAPGSDGIAEDARVAAADLSDGDAVVALARRERIDLVVVGPEAPLAQGLSDRLAAEGIATFGPSRAAAQLEASKAFAKDFMRRHQIPTAEYRVFDEPGEACAYVDSRAAPLVVKADGLAAGKGVYVCDGAESARAAIREIMDERRFGASGDRVVIEERLCGVEASFYAICDGERFLVLPAARDHKRALDGDAGENTGGMGAYTPVPGISDSLRQSVVDRILRPTIDGLREEGRPYRGVLYVGLMIDGDQANVIEFNVRFGDPETQPLLFSLESDLTPVLLQAARGELVPSDVPPLRFGGPAVCVVLASEGYPRSYTVGATIEGLDELAELSDVKVFHAGTRRDEGRWITAGGRVLGVTARAESLQQARRRVYQAVERVRFKGAHCRRDIAGDIAPGAGS